jgi:hypothetical protein
VAAIADDAEIAIGPIAVAMNHSPIKSILPVYLTITISLSWNLSRVIGERRHRRHEKPARAPRESSARVPHECLVRASCG